MSFTFLRDNLYSDFMTTLAGGEGVIRGPAGDGRAATVAQDDIAELPLRSCLTRSRMSA